MCHRHWLYEESEDGLDSLLPSARPRLMWAIPVSMSELGASIEAYSDTMPQISTLRLCHRFSSKSLSRLPQEIIEQIADAIRRSAYEEFAPGWHYDFLCFQSRCTIADHYHSYDEHIEDLMDSMVIEERPNLTKTQKVELVQEIVFYDSELFLENDGLDMHDEAQKRYIRRTCLCFPESDPSGFGRFNKVSGVQLPLIVLT
jgi:hypothetical protein